MSNTIFILFSEVAVIYINYFEVLSNLNTWENTRFKISFHLRRCLINKFFVMIYNIHSCCIVPFDFFVHKMAFVFFVIHALLNIYLIYWSYNNYFLFILTTIFCLFIPLLALTCFWVVNKSKTN